jgi:hypothetical protein
MFSMGLHGRMRTPLLLSPWPLLACVLNPAFIEPDPDTSDPAPPTSTPTTSTTAEPGSASTAEPDTTAPPVDPVDSQATTTDSTTDDPDPTTSTSTSTATTSVTTRPPDTDDTTDGVTDCWDDAPDSWTAAPIELDQFAESDAHDPVLSPDGLTLVYMAQTKGRPFRSTRAAPGDPFPNGEQIALWSFIEADFSPFYPRFAIDAHEMWMSYLGDIYLSKFVGGDTLNSYANPVQISAPLSTTAEDSHPTLSADGSVLIVQRDDGPPIADLTKSWRFHQYTRPAPTIGGPFTDDAQDVTPQVGPVHLALCPALSPDARHLLFSATTSPTLSAANASQVVSIFQVTRDSPQDPWGPPTELTTISPGGGVLCPMSVTADGCAMTFIKFPYVRFDQAYAMFLVEREP